jgi:hypothetical protein
MDKTNESSTGDTSKQTRDFHEEELRYLFPIERDEHMRHRIFIGVIEEGQRFEQVDSVVAGLCELRGKHSQNLGEAIALGAQVKVDKVAFGSTARDGTQFHAGDIARIGNCHAEKRI